MTVRRLHDTGHTLVLPLIILIFTLIRKISSIVDRTYIINAGNIIADGLPDEILRNEKARQIYLGDQFAL